MQKFHNIQPQFQPRPPARAKSTFLNEPKPPGPQPKADMLTATGRVFPKILFLFLQRKQKCEFDSSAGPRDWQVEGERERDSSTNHRLGASSSEKKVGSNWQTYPIQEAAGPEDHFPPERRTAEGERDRDKTNPVRTPLASLVPPSSASWTKPALQPRFHFLLARGGRRG